jgi:DNA repair protein RadC
MQDANATQRAARTLKTGQDVFECCWPDLGKLRNECFVLFSIDSRGRAIARDVISAGSLNSTVVHPRDLFKVALMRNAAGVILAHNHPSGDPEPSDDDIALTKRLVSAGQILGIPVHDHVIVTERSFASLRARNLV